jgi:hypothetical protein
MSQPEPGGSGGGRPPARRRLQDRLRQVRDRVRNFLTPRNRGPEPGLTPAQLEDIDQMDAFLNPSRPPTPAPAYGEDQSPPSFRTNPSRATSRSDPFRGTSRSDPSYGSGEVGDTSIPQPPRLPRRSAFLSVPDWQPGPGQERGDASRGGGPSRSGDGHDRPTFTIGSETTTGSEVSSNYASRTGSNRSQTAEEWRLRVSETQNAREQYWDNTRNGRDDGGHNLG